MGRGRPPSSAGSAFASSTPAPISRLEFVNVKPGIAKALDSLARFGFIRVADGGGSKRRKEPAASEKAQCTASIDLPNYYKVLGLKHSATLEEIRRAFHKLARLYHPDVTRDPDGPEKFMSISEAYAVLKSTKRRDEYDGRRAA